MSAAGDPLYFLIAGEPSGDFIGAQLMRALRSRLDGKIRFAGIGGEHMAAEGLTSLIQIRELAVMGIVEVLPNARRFLRLIRQTAETIRSLRPVAVVTIDSSGFCHRVTEKLKADAERPVLIHYVAPMVWAWRPHRARTAAGAVDHLLTLLPFEPKLFERVKLPATYVGHPVVESGAESGDGAAFRRRHGIAPDDLVICVLPGSRRGEVRRLLPIFEKTVALLRQKFGDLTVIVPTTDTVASVVRQAAETWSGQTIVVSGPAEKIDAFAASNVALAASGTVSLELAMAGLPMVIGYKMLLATAVALKIVLKVRYASLANILLDRPIVPEFIQERCRPDLMAAELETLLRNGEARRVQIEGTRQALDLIGRIGEPPSLRAADTIIGLVSEAARREAKPTRPA